MPAGRPRTLDDVKKGEVCALIAAGGAMAFAADYAGCTVKTIHNEADRDPEFAEKLRKARYSGKINLLDHVNMKASSDWRAAAWLLERSSPEHLGRPGQRLFKPKEVSNLLEYLRALLREYLGPDDQNLASQIVSHVIEEKKLPKGRRCTLNVPPPEVREQLARFLRQDSRRSGFDIEPERPRDPEAPSAATTIAQILTQQLQAILRKKRTEMKRQGKESVNTFPKSPKTGENFVEQTPSEEQHGQPCLTDSPPSALS